MLHRGATEVWKISAKPSIVQNYKMLFTKTKCSTLYKGLMATFLHTVQCLPITSNVKTCFIFVVVSANAKNILQDVNNCGRA